MAGAYVTVAQRYYLDAKRELLEHTAELFGYIPNFIRWPTQRGYAIPVPLNPQLEQFVLDRAQEKVDAQYARFLEEFQTGGFTGLPTDYYDGFVANAELEIAEWGRWIVAFNATFRELGLIGLPAADAE